MGLKWGSYVFGIFVAEVIHKVNPELIMPNWWLVVLLTLTFCLWYHEA
jgi:hypothetical protein